MIISSSLPKNMGKRCFLNGELKMFTLCESGATIELYLMHGEKERQVYPLYPSQNPQKNSPPFFFLTFLGVPVVDANMRELKSTGFMSNRGRQLVASFLVQVFSFLLFIISHFIFFFFFFFF